MNCLRCKAPMYQSVAGPNPPKATCSGCLQWVDCARCSSCGDVKCLACYNRKLSRAPKRSMGGLPPPQDEEI
jgi:hypothetical protein